MVVDLIYLDEDDEDTPRKRIMVYQAKGPKVGAKFCDSRGVIWTVVESRPFEGCHNPPPPAPPHELLLAPDVEGSSLELEDVLKPYAG